MSIVDKKEKLKKKIDQHLRRITRQLISFDTVQETLNYLLDSFYKEFTCDLVAVVLNEEGRLVPKSWIGEGFKVGETLQLDIDSCSPNLMRDALWWPNHKEEQVTCAFHEAMQKESLSTWFTVPLMNEQESFGICVIGFRGFVPLIIEAEEIFTQFGHDVAIALHAAREKERQKRKIKGMEWIKQNIFPGSSIEQVIEKVVERAGKGTQATMAAVYLFDENNSQFIFHPPAYGKADLLENVKWQAGMSLNSHFPFVEQTGGMKLTVPLIVHLKTIGALYVYKEDEPFSDEDLEFLTFVSDFVSMQIENARLYKEELEGKKRLERIMAHHQELVKKMVDGEDISDITKTISSMLESSIMLYDRFLQPISHHFEEGKSSLQPIIEEKVAAQKKQVMQLRSKEMWLDESEETPCVVWPIVGGRDVLGYAVLNSKKTRVDRVWRLTLDHALNTFAIEFIKQKLVLDATEQVKESFVNQLFEERMEDKEKIIQYAALTNWNIMEPHRVAVLTFSMEENDRDVVMMEEYKSWLWEQIKTRLTSYDPNIIFTRKNNEFIMIVKVNDTPPAVYWQGIYARVIELMKQESPSSQVYIGIGGKAKRIEEYYACYMEAAKAASVTMHRRSGGYSFYDDLGAYSILSQASDQVTAELFVKKKLGPLMEYSKNNQVDLLYTLYMFLQHNGNLRKASEELYIHRSTLEYRLERISDLLQADLNNGEVRFELMMAYKLYSLFDVGTISPS